ncbi:TPA: hypothetical protein ACXDAY_002152 [Clostridium botulinum]|uniref:hypothetical protein n=2 Tax=Clostridium botulinum TaxID=1491 RepID=UPI000463B3E3|nr:hypothetical protein [Clostridium botulinum]AUN01557.1 hypothetical protein RSJ19_00820 [Clostridium botulinum]MBN3359275.1 hypothetical protein [Clostridium botulinum]MBN3367100.1 hypothetical protein [Clostridium botulinum]MBN3371736.1 hypothetical protein [Clostridium botulinum]MBN3375458.1 hypothetical protein [Clostridium botulinum]
MIKKIFFNNTKDKINKFLSNSNLLKYNKFSQEVIEIENLITEIKMISNKEQLNLKQFNKESLTYLKSLLLQGQDYNTALISASKYQENYIKTLQSLPISQDTFNFYLALTNNNIEDAKELIMINTLQGGII